MVRTGPRAVRHDVDDDTEQPVAARLAVLAAFLPEFESPAFRFGEWHHDPGHFPYFSQSEETARFVGTAYNYGWVSSRIHWVEWIQTTEAQRFASDIGAIDTASAFELECLLTTVIRQDRFAEGNLASAFDSGMLTAIVRRASVLLRNTSD